MLLSVNALICFRPFNFHEAATETLAAARSDSGSDSGSSSGSDNEDHKKKKAAAGDDDEEVQQLECFMPGCHAISSSANLACLIMVCVSDVR